MDNQTLLQNALQKIGKLLLKKGGTIPNALRSWNLKI